MSNKVTPVGFIPFARINDEQRTVDGVMTSEALDAFNTVFDYDATKKAIFKPTGFQFWRNVRAMHQPVAAGVVDDIRCDDTSRKVDITARIVDAGEWEKVKTGVYKGFSIGGLIRASVKEEKDGKEFTRFTEYDLVEVSLVDRPANPDATFTVYRMDLDDAAMIAKWDAFSAADILFMLMNLLTQKIENGSVEDATALKPAIESVGNFLNQKIGTVANAADKLAVAQVVAEQVETASSDLTNSGKVAERAERTVVAQGSGESPAPLPPEPELITVDLVARALVSNQEFSGGLVEAFTRAVVASQQFADITARLVSAESRVAALESRARVVEANNRVAGPILREVTAIGKSGVDGVQNRIAALNELVKTTSDPVIAQAYQQELSRLMISQVHADGGNYMGQ